MSQNQTSYAVQYGSNRCITITPKGFSFKFYRIPYQLLLNGKHGVSLDNNYIVYLLEGKDPEGRDCLYVGTSSNGLSGRPTSHGDKNVDWKNCIVFTSFDPDLIHRGIIEYLEDRIRHIIDESKLYVNKTVVTVGTPSNPADKDFCERTLRIMLEAYDLCGIDLTPRYRSGLDSFLIDKPVTRIQQVPSASDFSSFGLPEEMNDWLRSAEAMMRELDPRIVTNIKSTYVNFKYGGVSKTVAYCYPSKRDRRIRVLFQGTPEWYKDHRVTMRSEHMHNGDCKAMFYITCAENLKYFRVFAETAIQKLAR